jgi:hypothetical protein
VFPFTYTLDILVVSLFFNVTASLNNVGDVSFVVLAVIEQLSASNLQLVEQLQLFNGSL